MKKIVLFTAVVSALATGCSKKDSAPDPAPPPDPPVSPAKITVDRLKDTTYFDSDSTVVIAYVASNAVAATQNGTAVALSGTVTLSHLRHDTTLVLVATGKSSSDTAKVQVTVMVKEYTTLAIKPWKLVSKKDSVDPTHVTNYPIAPCVADNLIYFHWKYWDKYIEKIGTVLCNPDEIEAPGNLLLVYTEAKKSLTMGLVEREIQELSADRLILREIGTNPIPGQPTVIVIFEYTH